MRLLVLSAILICSLSIQAQQYSRVKILLDDQHTMTDLARMGLDVDHGDYAPFKHFASDFSAQELAQIEAAGFQTKVLIADVQKHYVEQNFKGEAVTSRAGPCDDDTEEDGWVTPENFTYGTMGGYYTYDEMLAVIDDMAAKFPDLLSVREPIGDYLTHEGRPIYWLRLSDNPNQDEDEPEVFYNAIHHAREPMGLTELLFFMWYMLEHYDDDAEIKYLIDNTELYFVPCVNPDGYIYNEITNPNGGGFWRKNRRDNGNGIFGVDLNRNYGYQWGIDDDGSSPNPDGQTYRGPAPFSEPEIQAIRDFCNDHEFQIALNYHTYSNLLLYPWGHKQEETHDHDTFSAFAELMTRENDYVTGVSSIVLYSTNGDSNDWMYGETTTKAPIFAFVPEVGPGSTGFWPPQTDIESLAKDQMLQNIMSARLVLNYGEAIDLSAELLPEIEGEIDFHLTKYGLKNGGLSVSLAPVSNNIAWVGSPKNYGLLHLDEADGAIPFVLDSDIQNGEEVVFDLLVDNGIYTYAERLVKTYGDGTGTGGEDPTIIPVFMDAADDVGNWTVEGTWAATTAQYFSEPSSITDTPFGDYEAGTLNLISLTDPVEIVDAEDATLTFWARWDIEEDYDYVMVLAVDENGNSTPMCGLYTEEGTIDQAEGEPLYDGTQDGWVKEEIELSDYFDLASNPTIRIAFMLISDGSVEADGFYFDDLELTIATEGTTTTTVIDSDAFTLRTYPNPANDYTVLEVTEELKNVENAKVQIHNALGQKIWEMPLDGQQTRIQTADWETGVYFYQLILDEKILPAKRLNIAR